MTPHTADVTVLRVLAFCPVCARPVHMRMPDSTDGRRLLTIGLRLHLRSCAG